MLYSFPTSAQLNDGPIELRVRVREINTTFSNSSDGAVLGVGFLPDEYTYFLWARDLPDLDGLGWVGGNCLQANFNPPANSPDFNYQMFSFNYPGATVPSGFDIRLDAWEDDLPSDNLAGICNSGSRCAFDGSRCCGVVVFGACVGLTEGDDRRCDANPFRTNINYRLGAPCVWYNHGFLSGSCPQNNNYLPRIESYWRYTRGNNLGNPIQLGALNVGGSLTHANSTLCYTNDWLPSPGNDVFYSFTISQALGVNITLCGNATWNTNLYLITPSGQQLYFNNNSPNCPPQSQINENLCQPGTYIVVVDGNTVIEQGAFTLVIQEDPSISLAATVTPSAVSCSGGSDGSATISITGGTPPYSVVWNPGSFSGTTVNNLSAGSYTAIVTDAQNCVINRAFTITQPSPLSLSATGTNPLCFGGSNGSVNITNTSGGTPPYLYDIGGPQQASTLFSGLAASSYIVRVTDARNCTATTSISLTQPAAIIPNLTSTPVTCAGANDGTISVNPQNGTPPYTCSLNGSPVFLPCQTYTNLPSGLQTVTVRDAQGCEASAGVTIPTIPALQINLVSTQSVSCFGGNDGALTVSVQGGLPPYSLSLNNGITTQNDTFFTALTADLYTVRVADQNGCINTLNVTVSQPSILIPSLLFQIPVTCHGLNDGFVVITASGGTGPYQYSTDSIIFYSSGAFNNMPGGAVRFVVRDNNQCVATLQENVIEPAPLQVSLQSVTNASCNGINNGQIVLSSTGGTPPFKYNINNGPFQSGNTFSNLAPGTYQIGVEDRNDCVSFDSVVIAASIRLQVNHILSPPSCHGGSNGSIQVNVSGGTPPYSYSLNGITFQPQPLFSSLTANQYIVFSRDANGCTDITTIILSQPDPIQIDSVDITPASCPGISDGMIDLVVSGGTAPLSYNWTNGNITPTLTQVNGGIYTITISDANGCNKLETYTVPQPPVMFLTISRTRDVTCPGAQNGEVDVLFAGGTPPFQFLWSNGSTSPFLSNVAANLYTLSVTDGANCTTTVNATVQEPQPLQIQLSAIPVSCATSQDGSINALVTGGTTPYRFLWSNFSTGQSLNQVPAGTYVLLVTDANNCQEAATAVIQASPGLEAIFTVNDVSCAGLTDGQIDVQVSGGSGNYTYQWSNGSNTPSLFNISSGNYTLTITDNIGCTGVFQTSVGSPDSLFLQLSASDVRCFGEQSGLVIPLVSGGSAPYRFQWSTTATDTQGILTNVAAGNYTLTLLDRNNCSVSASATVGSPDSLSVFVVSSGAVTCATGDDGVVILRGEGGLAPYQYSLISNRFQTDSVFLGLTGGDYGAVLRDAAGCLAYSDFTVIEPDSFTILLDPIHYVTRGAAVSLKPSIISLAPIISYSWGPDNGLSCTDCLSPVANPLQNTLYTFQATDSLGCSVTALTTVIVKNEEEIFIPNAFSPNSDGNNDVFRPLDYGAAVEISIRIFNRWGELVFESATTESGWDGRYKGEPAGIGPYIYLIEGRFISGSAFKYQGSLSLFR